MKTSDSFLDRREALKSLGAAAFLGGVGFAAPTPALAAAERGHGPLKITKVRPFAVNTQGQRLVIVKVETSEPELYGLGCATYNQRARAVVTAVEEFLDPFCQGRDASNIDDLWQNAYTSSYWRNGPVLNNALSGVDMALWDIKGKRAGMPVYDLLGGKCRFAADTYSHAGGGSLQELEESVRSKVEAGFRHVRIQLGGYGAAHLSKGTSFRDAGFGLPDDNRMDSGPYLRAMPKAFEHIRNAVGDEIELLHDIHERIEPIEAVNLCKELEQYRPFFIEDPLAPEDNGYFKFLRQHTTVPIAMGELFNHPLEWIDLISGRLMDFIRVHLSQVGGLTPARKLAALGEWFNVRTAWHGPSDVSPVGHACNVHLDLAIHNFGIQEYTPFREATREVFPGCPELKAGFLHVSDKPGLGIDFNEEAAKKYPLDPDDPGYWKPVRRRDGTAVRP